MDTGAALGIGLIAPKFLVLTNMGRCSSTADVLDAEVMGLRFSRIVPEVMLRKAMRLQCSQQVLSPSLFASFSGVGCAVTGQQLLQPS